MTKKKKPCFNIITEAQVETLANCCGVLEVGNFRPAEDVMVSINCWDSDTRSWIFSKAVTPATKNDALEHIWDGYSYGFALATTIPSQKDAVVALKACGFKKLASTKSKDGDYQITIWTLQKPPRKRSTRKTAA